MANTLRDRDVRAAIMGLLEATGAFDYCDIDAWPDTDGQAAEHGTIVKVDPVDNAASTAWDGGGSGLEEVISGRCTITMIVRREDGLLADADAERLAMIVANTLNKQDFGGLCMPFWSRLQSWRWQKAIPPERRIAGTFAYRYLADDSLDASE